jgi:hypothetical protein
LMKGLVPGEKSVCTDLQHCWWVVEFAFSSRTSGVSGRMSVPFQKSGAARLLVSWTPHSEVVGGVVFRLRVFPVVLRLLHQRSSFVFLPNLVLIHIDSVG